jgi:hypothetical protein
MASAIRTVAKHIYWTLPCRWNRVSPAAQLQRSMLFIAIPLIWLIVTANVVAICQVAAQSDVRAPPE